MGELNLSPEELYSLSFRSLDNKVKGYQKAYRSRLELERFWIALLLQPHSKKDIKPEKLVRFDWEVKHIEVDKKAADESLKRILKRDGTKRNTQSSRKGR